MTEPFLVPEAFLFELRGTRQGRVSIAGYSYQAAYAVARLAAMLVRRPAHGSTDWPTRLRYDWAEDVDEVLFDESVCFTQCKRIGDIAPAPLAQVLLGFASKWLGVAENLRSRLRFRLVCTDQRLSGGGRLSNLLPAVRERVKTAFMDSVGQPPGAREDRRSWWTLANTHGSDRLFTEIWDVTDGLYFASSVHEDHPAGICLEAEREGVRILLEHGQIAASCQSKALDALRRILHSNLIAFDPTCEDEVERPPRSPDYLERDRIASALFALHPHWNYPRGPRLAFDVVDQTFLERARDVSPRAFVARPPEWSDVVRGEDEQVKFIERTQTAALHRLLIDQVLNEIERGTDRRCHAVFVTGAPGSGKTTLVRRVAAMLVLEGRFVVADPGVSHRDPRGSLDDYIACLEEFAEAGRPVLLVLDDPFYAESPWFELLHRLSRPGFRGAILAATPQFLYEKYGRLVTGVVAHRFDLGGPTPHERLGLARLHGRSDNQLSLTDDFLVLAMEAAAGVSFDEIIDRLWATLNDGQPIVLRQDLWQLPWPVRALLAVAFCHRVGSACPEPLLTSTLELTGGVAPGVDTAAALSQIRWEAGWAIFRLPDHDRTNWQYQGRLYTTNHIRIAQRAWERRPLPWIDIWDIFIRASTREPGTVRYVAEVATLLVSTDAAEDRSFISALVASWCTAAARGKTETRQLYDLATTLQVAGHRDLAIGMREVFRSRADTTADGWLAALQLWFLSSTDSSRRTFPSDIDLRALIDTANFSLASSRAIEFATKLDRESEAAGALVERLVASLDEQLSWSLDGSLLAWLLARAPAETLAPRTARVMQWLEIHPNDSAATPQFLEFLTKLPAEFGEVRRAMARRTLDWLSAAEHVSERTVRVKFLDYLAHPICDFHDLRVAAAKATNEWLTDHPGNHNVRAQYLDYLQTVSERLQPAHAPRADDPDAYRRAEFITTFAELRRLAAESTAAWLNEENRRNDSYVRVKYLAFLASRLCESNDLRLQAARSTAEWLREHDSDESVRVQWLTFLAAIHDDMLKAELRATLRWLESHDSPLVGRTLLTTSPQAGDTDLVLRGLDWASRFIERRRWSKGDQVMATAMIGPYYLALDHLTRDLGPAGAEEMLSDIKRSIDRWFAANPTVPHPKPPPRATRDR